MTVRLRVDNFLSTYPAGFYQEHSPQLAALQKQKQTTTTPKAFNIESLIFKIDFRILSHNSASK